MSTKTTRAKAATDLFALGNAWIVGHNYNRAAPLYVLHNLAKDLKPEGVKTKPIKSLAFEANPSTSSVPGIPDDPDQWRDLNDLVYGAFALDRRIFRDRTEGGASDQGALFPIAAGLLESSSSDDGLGDRLLDLLDKEGRKTTFLERIAALYRKDAIRDPLSRLATILAGDDLGIPDEDQNRNTDSSNCGDEGSVLDRNIAEMLFNLATPFTDARRISTLRDLAIGAHFCAQLRLLKGPIVAAGRDIPAIVSTDLPPGDPDDPIVSASSVSFRWLVEASWRSATREIASRLEAESPLPGASGAQAWRQRMKLLLDRADIKGKGHEAIMGALGGLAFAADVSAQDIVEEVLETRLGFGPSTMAQRVRSLGTKVGFVAPDRGKGRPRFVLDTPLLAVIVKGILGDEPSIGFRDFVSRLHTRFGLVLGLGSDDSFVADLRLPGYDTTYLYDLLHSNEARLRRRMLRSGLARTYSDSHTEVVWHGA